MRKLWQLPILLTGNMLEGHRDRYALVPKGTMLQVVSSADVRGLKRWKNTSTQPQKQIIERTCFRPINIRKEI